YRRIGRTESSLILAKGILDFIEFATVAKVTKTHHPLQIRIACHHSLPIEVIKDDNDTSRLCESSRLMLGSMRLNLYTTRARCKNCLPWRRAPFESHHSC